MRLFDGRLVMALLVLMHWRGPLVRAVDPTFVELQPSSHPLTVILPSTDVFKPLKDGGFGEPVSL